MSTYNCMKIHSYESGIIYNEDGIILYCPEEIINSIDDFNNPIWYGANIEHDPVDRYFYARLIDSYQGRYSQAAAYYQKAAEVGILPAMYNLAMCYIAGDGVEKNDREVLRWLEKGANGGNPSCLIKLGMFYDLGQILSYNPVKASYYYEKAALSNHPVAQNNIAYNYDNGEGVARSIDKAMLWYKKAAENGMESAQRWCISHNIRFESPGEKSFNRMITNIYIRSLED